MTLHFTKMQGCGNDYVYIDCFEGMPADAAQISVKVSKRHFAVGADGLICICKSDVADARMRMFNANGSESAMCGNGIRCVAQWLHEHDRCGDEVRIETGAGVKTLHRVAQNQWKVDMGVASFAASDMPAVGFGPDPLVKKELMVNGRAWRVSCVSVGNPHCITLVPDTAAIDIQTIGPRFEHHAAFPAGVNTEFIQQKSPTHLKMRVWERGSGETLACGTGASASVAACVALGVCPANTDVTVELLGGNLVIRVDENWRIDMTGPAHTTFCGQVEV